MRKTVRAIVPLVCLLAAACGGDDDGDDNDDNDADGNGEERRLVLFHTNDEHSHLFGFGPEIDDFPLPTEAGDGTIVGNIARRAELLDQERDALVEDEIDSLTVSAGDQTQGALPQLAFASTSPDFSLMVDLGYDIIAPGNHEFDLGPEPYAAAIEAVPDMPPIVSTNIFFSEEEGDDALEALYGEGLSDAPITPYQILETPSGIRVGFIGIMGVNAAFVAPNKGPVQFSGDPADEGDQETVLPAIYEDLQPAVDALREEGVDVVVALSHSGVDVNTPELGDDYNIAQNVSGIDIIVSGHTHTALEEAVVVEGPDGHDVPIVQAGFYGRYLGRVELVLPADAEERPQLASAELLEVDDRIVPSNDTVTSELDALIADLEANELPAQLSRIEGIDVTDDPKVLGDLYYREMGGTDFDIIGIRSRTETNVLNLANDARLFAAAEVGFPAEVSVEASGTVRADMFAGESGVLSYADLFRVFPLGENPMDGSIGFPLCRFSIYSAELKSALEVGVSQGYIDESFYLSTSGLLVEYDTSRDPQDLSGGVVDALDPENGRITLMVVDTNGDDIFDQMDEVIFDLSLGPGPEAWGPDGPFGNPEGLHSVVTSLYIASFADTAGVTLKDDDGSELQLFDTILRREDDTDVKDYEAFIRYVLLQSEDNDGVLPARYNEKAAEGTVPRHMICSGPLCEK